MLFSTSDMVEFTKPEAYIRQIVAYLTNKNFKEAYKLSKEFLSTSKETMISHYFVARSAFKLKKYDEAKKEARIAFNLSKGKRDMIVCANLFASICYKSREYQEGVDFLSKMANYKNTEIQALLFLFSIKLKDKESAVEYMENLYSLDKKRAHDLVLRLFEDS